MLPKWSPGRPWREVLEPNSGHWEKDLDFEAYMYWAPRGPTRGTLVGALFALGPLLGRSKEARGAIFRQFLVSPTLDPQFDTEK